MTTATLNGVKVCINAVQLKEMKAAIKGLKHSKVQQVPQNIRLTMTNGLLTFEAQDMINYIQLRYEDPNNSEGYIVLDKKVIKDLKLKKDDIAELEVLEDNNVKITINGLTFTTLQDEFWRPLKSEYTQELQYTVNKGYISSLKNSLKFVSTMETRPILQGICHSENEIVCTDSHQLYTNKELHSLNNGTITVHNLTAKVVTDLVKSDEKLTFTVSDCEDFVKYESEHITVIGRLINGRYPVTKNMIPTYYKAELELNKSELEQIINTFKNMLSYADTKNKVVVFKIVDNVLNISVTSKANEKIEKEFNNINISGEDLRISFNIKNVLNSLEQQKGKGITLSFTGEMSPFMVKTESDELYLYSPVRTY